MIRAGRDWRQRFTERIGCRVSCDEEMSRHTTLGVGGSVSLMAWLAGEDALVQARHFLDAEKVESRVLGKGSNILVSDNGYEGAVLRLSGGLARASIMSANSRNMEVQAGGGLALQKFLAWAAREGAGGLDGLVGIPGTVGGAIKLNAGTRWGTISDRLIEVRLLEAGRPHWVSASRLGFGYRTSAIGRRRVVIAARLRLPRQAPEQVRRAYEKSRRLRRGQPLGARSAGSFFLNPGAESAGRLIESAGCKGEREGGALVSERHANFIVNSGHATASDIIKLSRRVARRVFQSSGIKLEREVELWGRFRPKRRSGRSA